MKHKIKRYKHFTNYDLTLPFPTHNLKKMVEREVYFPSDEDHTSTIKSSPVHHNVILNNK